MAAPLVFGGALPDPAFLRRFQGRHPAGAGRSHDAPTSPGPATARARSSRRPRTWSCGTRRSAPTCQGVGIFTLPQMELPFGELQPLMDEIQRVADRDPRARQVPRRPSAASTRSRRRWSPPRRRSTRACTCCRSMRTPTCATATWGRSHNHACAMRRSLEHATITQVGIRSMSTEEAQAVAGLKTKIFYDFSMRQDPNVDRRRRRLARRPGLHHR